VKGETTGRVTATAVTATTPVIPNINAAIWKEVGVIVGIDVAAGLVVVLPCTS
jgi:hypothetical protein